MRGSTIACACVVAWVVSCSAPRPPTSPEPATDVPDTEEAEPVKPAGGESQPAATSAPAPAPDESKPPCESLQKSRCKVQQGCAWYELSGKGKCVEE